VMWGGERGNAASSFIRMPGHVRGKSWKQKGDWYGATVWSAVT
jgi:hypothetical protein